MKRQIASFALLSVLLSLNGIAIAAETSTTTTTGVFSDVPRESFSTDSLEYLKENNIVSGYPDGTFKPTAEINRAEFTKIIVGALTDSPKGSNCFSDVKDEWFAPYVCEAKERKIIDGYADGTFKPAENINFSEASKIVANAFGVTPDNGGDPNAENWYQPFVVGLETQKAIPLSVDFFDEKITRDEMAEMTYRLKAKVTDKGSRSYKEIEGDSFVTVDSCKQLEDRYEHYLYKSGSYNTPGDVYYMEGMGAGEPAAAPAPTTDATKSAEESSSSGSADYSTTNVQVEGVDEADIIKNDGKYIYLIKGNSVRIIEAYPADNMKELVSFQLGDADETFYPSEMYVDGNKLVVVGSKSFYYTYPMVEDTSTMDTKMISPSYYGSGRTKVFIVDVTDHSKPTVKRSVEFDGNYSTSRKVDGTLYMVMNKYPYYPVIYNETTGEYDRDTTGFIPMMKDSKNTTEEIIVPCNKVMLLPKPQNFNFLITAAIPVNDETKDVSRAMILGDTQNVYASKESLYVAATDWGNGYYQPYGSFGTQVYRFALGDGTIEYASKGKVPGNIINQFSMDESNKTFRIATTKNEYDPDDEMSNGVYVFDQSMKQLGKIEGIAPGEKIYSTRFMGNRLYMVTFKTVDPLFVIDLSNSASPKILGKLKVPGYSTYLHPYDETHLIGFGNDVDESIDADKVHSEDAIYYTAVLGMKIAMFDVTDVNHPKEMFKEVIGDRGTTSDVLYNHKALLFDKEKGLMAFPLTVYEIEDPKNCSENTYSTCQEGCQKICVPKTCTYDNGIKVCSADCDGENSCVQQEYTYGKPTFQGAYVYNVDLTNGFSLKGKVSHYTDEETAEAVTQGWFSDYEKTIMRALYIGENLYTVSSGYVKANALSDLAEKSMLKLADATYDLGYDKPMPL
ncbi:beta-propeller domain-containing protein [Candidatus Peregrinibacteria bacterium]|nr:beta-propeller domain-containing protein [Candidatus Peregrinibacteria bacterium]